MKLLALPSSPTTKDCTSTDVTLGKGKHTNSPTHQKETNFYYVSDDTVKPTRQHSVSGRMSNVGQVTDAYWLDITFGENRHSEHFQPHVFRSPITFDNKMDSIKELDEYSSNVESVTLQKSILFRRSGKYSTHKFSVNFEILERKVGNSDEDSVEIFNVRSNVDGCYYVIHKISLIPDLTRKMDDKFGNNRYGQIFGSHRFGYKVRGRHRAIRRISELAKLNHSNVVKYLNFWMEGDYVNQVLYIQMEQSGERTLQNEIDFGELYRNDDRIWKLFHGIVSGLAYIHGLGVVHGKLNTENVFVDTKGEAKIGNFLISRVKELYTELSVIKLYEDYDDDDDDNCFGGTWISGLEMSG